MKQKAKGRIRRKSSCLVCSNCIPIGEGDHICNECGEPVVVLSEYEPTDDYLKCGGDKFET